MSALFFSNNPVEVLAAIYKIETWLLTSFALCFCILTFGGIKAAYGRYSSESWGPRIPGVIDWYMHSTALVGLALSILKDDFRPLSKPKMDPKKIKPIPIFILIWGSGFCLMNGFLNSRYLTLISKEDDLNTNLLVVGSLIWGLGFYGNVWHDRRLLSLKRQSGGVYVIPSGGLFEYISGANFFCEIVEWLGYAIACSFSLPATAFVFLTASNIGPRGWHHHQYYLEKFPDYPKSRKAIVPFLI